VRHHPLPCSRYLLLLLRNVLKSVPLALRRYLHQSHCAHTNLDTNSYMVTADFRVKLSALGAAHLFDGDYGNIPNVAEEFAEDVFAFGGVVWEVRGMLLLFSGALDRAFTQSWIPI
jgi:hypothetical protein